MLNTCFIIMVFNRAYGKRMAEADICLVDSGTTNTILRKPGISKH
jgi:hypothetical protein